MASEPSNLRHLFGEPSPTPAIDVSTVIRRSRARRAPRVLGAGAFAVLTVGALAYGGLAGLAGLGGVTASDAGGAAPMMESEDGATSSMEGDTGFMDAKSSLAVADLVRCGEPVAEIPSSGLGLVLTVAFPSEIDADAASVEGTVTLTNDGAERVVATVSETPVVALVDDGTVVSAAAGGFGAKAIDLDVGESLDYAATFTPTACGGVSPLPAGDYEVLAAVDLSPSSGQPWLTSPTQRVTLR